MKKQYILLVAIFSIWAGIAKSQIITDVVNFHGSTGNLPQGGLTLSADGNVLYGMTNHGGTSGFYGCIFSVNKSGTGYRVVHSFNSTDGAFPQGNLTLSGNKLYGMTLMGGPLQYGNIFYVDTDGSNFTSLYNFSSTNGVSPYGSLILSGARLFGMTRSGGTYGYGNIFSIDTNGSGFTNLFSFNHTDGGDPYGSLILSGNKFYGEAENGGAYGYGAIFSVDTNGTGYRDMFDFDYTNGEFPYGTLVLAGKALYGMTYSGGTIDEGTIFSIDTDGSRFQSMYNFSGTDGAYPLYGATLTYSAGLLYGMTRQGGTSGVGVIFSMDTDGSSYQVLASFNITDGSLAGSSLTMTGNTMYGMTYQGGVYDSGVVFRFSSCTINVMATPLSGASCYGGSNGSASVSPLSGTSPFTYFWGTNPIQTTAVATGLSAGSYTVTVTDSGGCANAAVVVITQPLSVGDTMESLCAGCCNCHGAAWDSVYGGTSPYTFSWSNGSTTDTIHGVPGGSYTCMVTDAKGCTHADTVWVPHGNPVSPSSGSVSCYGGTNGTAAVVTTGNNTYVWSPYGGSNSIATGLSAGVYFVTITNTDTTSCIVSEEFTITQPPLLIVNAGGSIPCNGGTGTATAIASGGTPGYNYSWNPGGGSGASDNGLSAGAYTVTVTDNNLCTATAVVTLTQPPALTGSSSWCCGYNPLNTCADSACYSFIPMPVGGTPPYTYSGGPPDFPACNDESGTLTITDAGGCMASVPYSLTVGLLARLQVNSNVTCHGGNNGSATVIIWASTLLNDATYSWNPGGGTNQTETNLSAGTYTIVITDPQSGCTNTRVIAITEPPAIIVLTDSAATTGGNCNGSATAMASNGIAPYTYNWSPGGLTTDTITNQCAGDYCCNVTDANGCMESVCVNIATSTGINEVKGESGEVIVYPNPNNGVFTVTFSHAELVSASQPIARVINVLGQQVYFATLNQVQGDNLIDISSQPDGIYLVRIENEDGTLITEQKIVKM